MPPDEKKPEVVNPVSDPVATATPPATPAVVEIDPFTLDGQVILVDPCDPLVDGVSKLFSSDKDVAFHRVPNENEASQLALQTLGALVIISTANKDHVIAAMKLLKICQAAIKRKDIKVIVVSKFKDSRMTDTFVKSGCAEYILNTVSANTFSFKVRLHLKSLKMKRAQSKKGTAADANRVVKGAGDKNKGTGKEAEANRAAAVVAKAEVVPPLETPLDTWLLGSRRPKKFGVNWAVEVEGPDPITGGWSHVGFAKDGTSADIWQWNEPGINEGWRFSGNQPFYNAQLGQWKLVGPKPVLSLVKEGQSDEVKIGFQGDGRFLLASDSPAAASNLAENRKRAKEIRSSGKSRGNDASKKDKNGNLGLPGAVAETPNAGSDRLVKAGEEDEDPFDSLVSGGKKSAPSAGDQSLVAGQAQKADGNLGTVEDITDNLGNENEEAGKFDAEGRAKKNSLLFFEKDADQSKELSIDLDPENKGKEMELNLGPEALSKELKLKYQEEKPGEGFSGTITADELGDELSIDPSTGKPKTKRNSVLEGDSETVGGKPAKKTRTENAETFERADLRKKGGQGSEFESPEHSASDPESTDSNSEDSGFDRSLRKRSRLAGEVEDPNLNSPDPAIRAKALEAQAARNSAKAARKAAGLEDASEEDEVIEEDDEGNDFSLSSGRKRRRPTAHELANGGDKDGTESKDGPDGKSEGEFFDKSLNKKSRLLKSSEEAESTSGDSSSSAKNKRSALENSTAGAKRASREGATAEQAKDRSQRPAAPMDDLALLIALGDHLAQNKPASELSQWLVDELGKKFGSEGIVLLHLKGDSENVIASSGTTVVLAPDERSRLLMSDGAPQVWVSNNLSVAGITVSTPMRTGALVVRRQKEFGSSEQRFIKQLAGVLRLLVDRSASSEAPLAA